MDIGEILSALHSENRPDVADAMKEDGRAILSRIISFITQYGKRLENQVACQTVDTTDALYGKLANVDLQFGAQVETNRIASRAMLEEKLLKVQHECEKRIRQEMMVEFQQWKESELKHVRIKEQERHEAELSKMHESFQREYETKKLALKEQEEQSLEKINRKTRDSEAEMYQERQKMLRETEHLKEREDTLKRELELSKRSLSLLEDQTRDRQTRAQETLMEAQRMKDEFCNRLRDEMNKFQLHFENEHAHRVVKLKTDCAQLELGQKELEKNKLQFSEAVLQAQILTQQVSQLKDSKAAATTELEILRRETMSLRQNNEQLQNALTALQKQWSSVQSETQQGSATMKDKLVKMTDQIQRLEKSLQLQTEAASKYKKAAIQYKKQYTETSTKLDAVMYSHEDTVRKLEDENIRNKENQREIADLRLMLFRSQTILVTNTQTRGTDKSISGDDCRWKEYLKETVIGEENIEPERQIVE